MSEQRIDVMDGELRDRPRTPREWAEELKRRMDAVPGKTWVTCESPFRLQMEILEGVLRDAMQQAVDDKAP